MRTKLLLFSILTTLILSLQVSLLAQNNSYMFSVARYSEENYFGSLMKNSAPSSTFILPVTKDTSNYWKYDATRAVPGKFHTGNDYYNPDLKVVASNCGVVVGRYTVAERNDRGLGNTLIIKHNITDGGTAYSLYGHLKSFAAGTEMNKYVSRGQTIGIMGKTGSGSNDIVHLHYEMKRSGVLGNSSAFGTSGVNALVGYVWIKAGNGKTATSATNYGYWKPSVGDFPAVCR